MAVNPLIESAQLFLSIVVPFTIPFFAGPLTALLLSQALERCSVYNSLSTWKQSAATVTATLAGIPVAWSGAFLVEAAGFGWPMALIGAGAATTFIVLSIVFGSAEAALTETSDPL